MALSAEVQGRLVNHKFQRALELAAPSSEVTGDEMALLTALATLLGNTGWVEGSLGVLVGTVVDVLLEPPAAEPGHASPAS